MNQNNHRCTKTLKKTDHMTEPSVLCGPKEATHITKVGLLLSISVTVSVASFKRDISYATFPCLWEYDLACAAKFGNNLAIISLQI